MIAMPPRRDAVLILALVGLSALSVYGFWSRHLWQQAIWEPAGAERFLIFLAAALVWFGGWILIRPAWLLPATAALAAIYSAAAVGILPILAAAFFLFACFVLGSIVLPESGLIGLLAGMSIVMSAAGVLAHFAVNYPATWLALLGAVLLARPGITLECLRRVAALVRPDRFIGRRDTGMLAVALVPLLAHWLVVLKPEVSDDALSMHLVVPAFVANHHLWSFDFRHFVWAVMPMDGVWGYTVTYLLGGEFAARLLNLGLLGAICGLVYGCALRWVRRPSALLLAALFAATPVVQLVTGSLFVETFYAALIAGALAAIWQFHDSGHRPLLVASALLLASAMAVKLTALVFVLPAGLVLAWQLVQLWRKAEKRWLIVSALVFLAVAPQPYLYAWWKTGNPVFPFFNNIFRSPWFDPVATPDPRFSEPLTWRTPFDVTFETHRYWEGQDGSAGFQFLLLVPLVLVSFRRDWRFAEWTLAGVAIGGILLGLALRPNVRYLYPGFPLLTLAIALILRGQGAVARRAVWCAALASMAVNLWFLPSSSWYHKTFCLNPFDRSAAREYVAATAPVRLLVDRLNQEYPDENALFLETMDVAGLRGKAYTDGWHSHVFLQSVMALRTPADARRMLEALGVRHFVFPDPARGIPVREAQLTQFLAEFTQPEARAGGFELARLRQDSGADQAPAPTPPGRYDDFDPRIRFFAHWSHDPQFAAAANHSLTYSDIPDAAFRFQFRGSAITWVYTKALNRGVAEVRVDGESRGTVDLYSPDTVWQARTVFDGLGTGAHVLEVRILDKKNPRSAGRYVDVDELIVE